MRKLLLVLGILAMLAETGLATVAEFIGNDTTTKGEWYTGSQADPTYTYGALGYEIVYYPVSSGWTEALGNNLAASYTNQTGSWAQYSNMTPLNNGANSDTKFLRNPDEGLQPWTNRYNAFGYSTDSANPIIIQFDAVSEDMVRIVSFYAVDTTGKNERIEIYDQTGTTLLAQSDNFSTLDGVYARFEVTGSFQAKVVRQYETGNVILSGYFVDGVPEPATLSLLVIGGVLVFRRKN